MSGVAAAVVAGGMAAGAVLVAAAALRPLAGALTRWRAHRRTDDAVAARSAFAAAGAGERHATAPGQAGEPTEDEDESAGEGSVAGAASGVGRGRVWATGAETVRSVERRRRGVTSSRAARPDRVPRPSSGDRLVALRRRADGALQDALVAADLEVELGRALRMWVGGGVAVVVLASSRWGGPGAVLAVVVATGAPLAALSWRRGRATHRLSAALPGVLEVVAGRLRAGASLPEAVSSAADESSGSALLDADLRDLQRRVTQGQPFADAIEGWAERRPVPGVALVAAALVLGAEAGGARARAVDGVAATLRDRQAVAAEVDALATQARASAFVMMGAPLAFAALGLLSDPEVARFLLATPAGLACLVVGLGLDALAGWWMVGIARSAR